MKRTTATLAALACLAIPASAFGQAAGHNGPTRTLEAAFKIAQFERAHSDDGCYPAPAALASAIDAGTRFKSSVAKSFKKVRRPGVVYVVKRKARCGHVNLALRAKGALWVLDSTKGTVGKPGSGGAANKRDEAGGRGPLRALKLVSKPIRLTSTDQAKRGEVKCPGRSFPLGGGLTPSNPPISPDGEGLYPHSFERLGAQRGWHVNPVLIDPQVLVNSSNPGTVPRTARLQVVCGKGLVAASGPRKTIFLRSGQSGTVTAKCPKGQALISGGFQRSNFRTIGGSYVTESRAVGRRGWRVSGRSFAGRPGERVGGEITAIAYCDKSKRRLLTEVTASAPLPDGALASATTPRCRKGRQLTSGGFSFNGSHNGLFAAGFINRDRTWSVQGYGYFGAAPAITAFGYCLQTKSKLKFAK